MEYETIIGLEVHVQLLTRSKMFCRCSSDYASAPANTHVCPVCLGMPGVLPTVNVKAVEYTVMTALALNCEIPDYSKFDRKNYPYPDLMKGYQISQYDRPLSRNGRLDITVNGAERSVGITRVHLEEDVAKLVHVAEESGETYSLVDVNRSGVPLMEIVSEPDMRSAEEAREYLVSMRTILQYLGVSTGNMEEGSFRCDANISIRPVGSDVIPASKVEVKNMNSFKAVYRALQFEEERQRKAAATGARLVQETRGWVDDKGVTVSQRTKEFAHDYRYFPEPDLPPLRLSRQRVEEIRAGLPVLPGPRRAKFISEYGLSKYDSELLTVSKAMADYFETCLAVAAEKKVAANPKTVANWLLGEFTRALNQASIDISASRVSPERLVELVDMVDKGTLSTSLAKTVFDEMFSTGKKAAQIVSEKGLAQISGAADLDAIITRVLDANPQPIADFKKGKEQALVFLVGQVMRLSKGQANPKLVNQLLREKLTENTAS